MNNELKLTLALAAASIWAVVATVATVYYHAQAANCALQLGVFPQ